MTQSPGFGNRAGRQIQVGEIVRDVVAEVRPAELPVVEGLCALDPRTVRRRLRRRSRRDPVEFGLDAAVAMIAPAAWIAVDELLRHVVDEASGPVAGRIGRWLRAAARRIAGKSRPALTGGDSLPPLSRIQLEQVKRRVTEVGPGYGLTEEAAAALGERVVARLVLAIAGPGTEGTPSAGAATDPVSVPGDPGGVPGDSGHVSTGPAN